ncbi:MAG: hypothetical protein MI755_16885 [Sphingomonadales bacterium]|nr:hypothetical protein [Sphingomonadales bacterium]
MTGDHPFIDRLKGQLDELAEELDKLEAQSRKYDAKMKAEYDKRAEEFKELLDEGKSNFEAFREMSERELDQVKDNLEFTAKALRNSFHYFMSHYKHRDD